MDKESLTFAPPDLYNYKFWAELCINQKYFIIYGTFPTLRPVSSGWVAYTKDGMTIIQLVDKNSPFYPFVEAGDHVLAMNGERVISADSLTTKLRGYRGYFEVLIMRPGIEKSTVSNWSATRCRIFGKFVFHRLRGATGNCDRKLQPCVVCRELIVVLEDDDSTLISEGSSQQSSRTQFASTSSDERTWMGNFISKSLSLVGIVKRKLVDLGSKQVHFLKNLEYYTMNMRYVRVTMDKYAEKQGALTEHVQRSTLPTDVSIELNKMVNYLPDQLKLISNVNLLSNPDELSSDSSEDLSDDNNEKTKTQFAPEVYKCKIKSDIKPSQPLKRCKR